jgi:hypothetical protein
VLRKVYFTPYIYIEIFAKKLIIATLMPGSSFSYAESSHRCAAAAIKQAQQLLKFHAGPDGRIVLKSKRR